MRTVAACAAAIFRASVRCARNGLMSGENPAATRSLAERDRQARMPTTNPGWPWRTASSAFSQYSSASKRSRHRPATKARSRRAQGIEPLRLDRADETQRGVQVFRAHGLRLELRDRAAPTCAVSAAFCSGVGCSAKNSLQHASQRGCWQRAQQVQCVLDRLAAHRIAIALELDEVTLALEAVFLPVRQREPHRAHGLARHGAARARRCHSPPSPRSRRCARSRLRPWRAPPHRSPRPRSR